MEKAINIILYLYHPWNLVACLLFVYSILVSHCSNYKILATEVTKDHLKLVNFTKNWTLRAKKLMKVGQGYKQIF